MTYNPAIPGANDLISNSQGQIQNNFAQLNTIFSNDHYTFNDTTNGGADRGMHKQVTIPIASSADPVLSAAVTGQFYTKTIAGIATPFFAGWNGSGTVVAPLATPSGISGNGFLVTNGIIMKWGNFTGGPGAGNYAFPTGAGIPAFTNTFQVYLQPSGYSGVPNFFAYIASFNAGGFIFDSVARTTNTGVVGNYAYFAIGN